MGMSTLDAERSFRTERCFPVRIRCQKSLAGLVERLKKEAEGIGAAWADDATDALSATLLLQDLQMFSLMVCSSLYRDITRLDNFYLLFNLLNINIKTNLYLRILEVSSVSQRVPCEEPQLL